MPIKTLIFHAYGTVYNVHSVYAKIEEFCPGKSDLITRIRHGGGTPFAARSGWARANVWAFARQSRNAGLPAGLHAALTDLVRLL